MNHYNLASPASSNDYIPYMALSRTSKLLSSTEGLQAPMVSVVLYPSVIVLELIFSGSTSPQKTDCIKQHFYAVTTDLKVNKSISPGFFPQHPPSPHVFFN